MIADFHRLLHASAAVNIFFKGLVDGSVGPGLGSEFDERSEAKRRDILVGLVGREKLEDRVVPVPSAEACDPLTAVHVKSPHRNAVKTSDAGKKITEEIGRASCRER